jgi:hypothetical protein
MNYQVTEKRWVNLGVVTASPLPPSPPPNHILGCSAKINIFFSKFLKKIQNIAYQSKTLLTMMSKF